MTVGQCVHIWVCLPRVSTISFRFSSSSIEVHPFRFFQNIILVIFYFLIFKVSHPEDIYTYIGDCHLVYHWSSRVPGPFWRSDHFCKGTFRFYPLRALSQVFSPPPFFGCACILWLLTAHSSCFGYPCFSQLPSSAPKWGLLCWWELICSTLMLIPKACCTFWYCREAVHVAEAAST